MKTRVSWLRTLALLSGTLAPVACASESRDAAPGAETDGGQQDAEGLTVRIFQTSGLPPVSYSVSDAQAIASLGERIAGLAVRDRPEAFFDFGPPTYEIQNEAGLGGLSPRIRFWNGTLEVLGSDGTAVYHSDEKGVYTWLMDEGARALPPLAADSTR